MVTSRFSYPAMLLAVGFIALMAIEATTFWLGARAQEYALDVTRIREMRISAVELRNALLTAESSQRGYLFSGNEIYLAPFDTAKSTARREVGELNQDLARYPQLEPMISQLDQLVGSKISDMDDTVALKQARNDVAAMDVFLSNRGKAIMDRANVFLNGLIDAADEMQLAGVREQVRNANLLRWTSLLGGIIIIVVVGAVILSFIRSTREILRARDEVRAINETLEARVAERTSALASALERSEVLLAEVNHRVANSLAMVASLVRLQIRSSEAAPVKEALGETEARISAIAAVHKRLYESGDVGLVALDEYLSGLLESLAATMRAEGHGGSLSWSLEPASLDTDASINVGVVVTELVTNAYKYAYPEGRGDIRVRMQRDADARLEIVVEDDGVGKSVGPAKGTGLGTRIVRSMAASLGTEVEYLDRPRGTSARISIPI